MTAGGEREGGGGEEEEDLVVEAPERCASPDVPPAPAVLDSFPDGEKKKGRHHKKKRTKKIDDTENSPSEKREVKMEEEEGDEDEELKGEENTIAARKANLGHNMLGNAPQAGPRRNVFKYQDVASQLHYHAGTGNWEIMESLLENNDGPDVIGACSVDGRTVMHVTAALGHMDAVEGLHRHGAAIDAKMDDGLTPLMLACGKGMIEAVRFLLQRGADPYNQSIKDGYNALHLAIMNQQHSCSEALLSFVRNKSESRLTDLREAHTVKGYTPLHFAVVENDMRSIRTLVDDYGAQIDSRTAKKWTPLHFAAYEGNEQVIKYLLEKRANPVLRNLNGAMPFHLAEHMGHDEEICKLIDPQKFKDMLKEAKKQEKEEKKEEKRKKKEEKKNRKKDASAASGSGPGQTATELLDIDSTNWQQYYVRPAAREYDGRAVWERIQENPELIQTMKDDPIGFFDTLPPDLQMMIVNEMENNPEVTQQIMEIANNVTQRIMNERPELLMEAVKDPLSLLKKHKNPMKIMQMVKENPMSVLEDEYQENPELFMLKFLQENPSLQLVVIDEVKKVNEKLLPLLSALMGELSIQSELSDQPQANAAQDEPKGKLAKAKQRAARMVAKRIMKSMTRGDQQETQQVTPVNMEIDMSKIQQQFQERHPEFFQNQQEVQQRAGESADGDGPVPPPPNVLTPREEEEMLKALKSEAPD